MEQKPLVILQVDRDLASTRSLRVELRRRGARLCTAASREQAFATSEAPDLVILDGGLETGDARALTEEFAQRFPRAETILFDDRGGVGMGLLFCAAKPVSRDTLLDVITLAFPGRLKAPATPPPEPRTVLCVDDDPGYLRSVTRLLTRHGYKVSAFTEPREVMEAIPRVSPDLILLDVMMPGLDGYQLAEEIRKQYRGMIPVVMISGKTSSADTMAGHRYGASYYIPKPCDAQRLLDVVDFYAGDLDPEERDSIESKL